METECNPSKPRYDISMSKRTRKAAVKVQELTNQNPGTDFLPRGDDEKENGGKISLKQLIHANDARSKVDESISNVANENKSRSSLGQHFTEEEKQLQPVRKQKQEGIQGVKLKGLVGHYVKALGHSISVKREPRITSRKKPLLRLAM